MNTVFTLLVMACLLFFAGVGFFLAVDWHGDRRPALCNILCGLLSIVVALGCFISGCILFFTLPLKG